MRWHKDTPERSCSHLPSTRSLCESRSLVRTGRNADNQRQPIGGRDIEDERGCCRHRPSDPRAPGRVIAAFETAIARVHDEPGVDVYALHEGPDRLVMIEKYESALARSVHSEGAALADLLAALKGKLSGGPDLQVLAPHPYGDRQKGAL